MMQKGTGSKKFSIGTADRSIKSLPKRFRVSERLGDWSRSAFSDRVFLVFVFLWIAPILTVLLFSFWRYQDLPNQIPLFYSHVWGESQLAVRSYVFLPSAGVVLLGLFNLGLAISFHEKEKVLSYFLAGTAGLISVISAITIYNIVVLVS